MISNSVAIVMKPKNLRQSTEVILCFKSLGKLHVQNYEEMDVPIVVHEVIKLMLLICANILHSFGNYDDQR